MRFVITGILMLIIIIMGTALKLKQEEKTRKMTATEDVYPYIPISKPSVYNHAVYTPKHPVLFFKSCTTARMPTMHK